MVLARGGVAAALRTEDGWVVTSLVNGRALTALGRARINDVAFSPDATTVAMATESGVVFADLPALAPRSFLEVPAGAVAWFEASRFPFDPAQGTVPVRSLLPIRE